MAKRCLEHFSLENTQYDFMTFSDLSFLVDNPYYGTNVGSQDSRVSIYGTNVCQVHSSDSAYMHNMDDTSAIFQKELSTSYSGYTNFNLWINNTDTIVISNGMLTSEVSSRDVRWAIILDDSEKLGWVVSRHVDGNCYVCGGDNDTGGLIYYAFMYGVISNSGGAGSGYIGNSLVSNKKMVGYNVPTSSAESTKTESVNEASESPVSGKPKIGNGFARIKLLREPVIKTIEQIAKNVDFANHYKLSNVSAISAPMPNVLSDLISYYGTDWNLQAKSQTNDTYVYQNGVFKTVDANNEHWQYIVIPLDNTYTVCGIKLDIKQGERRSDGNGLQFFCGKYTQGNTPYFTDAEDGFMCIAKLPCHWGSKSTRFFTEIPADFNDWQTVEASILNPIKDVNYIAFCTWASPIEVKNIKLTVL